MKREELLKKVAPCSLMCHTCGAYAQGIICDSARKLLEYLDGVYDFYVRHSPKEAERYQIFQEELKKYGAGYCAGCRDQEHSACSIEGCFILTCTKEHGADYCGECAEFPCDRTKELFEEEVYLQWMQGNTEIKNTGIENFWIKNSTKPHYKAYKCK